MSAAEVHPGNSGRADYPRMLFHPDGRNIVVDTPEAHDKLHQEGWDTAPPAEQRAPPTAFGVLGSTSDPLIEAVRQVIREEVRALLREEFNLRNIGKRYSNYG